MNSETLAVSKSLGNLVSALGEHPKPMTMLVLVIDQLQSYEVVETMRRLQEITERKESHV